MEPGPVLTPLLTNIIENSNEFSESFDDILKDLYRKHVKSAQSAMTQMMQEPEEIAQLHLEIILSDNPHLRYQTSEIMTKYAASKLADTTSDGLLEALKQ